MNWFEPLPDQCPPKEAVDTDGYTVFRIAASDPATDSDLHSHRKINPDKIYPVDECRACSLSVYDDYEATLNVTKLPAFKKKTNFILQLNLKSGDGLIQKTSGPNHYSWWRSAEFMITV
jgi:hypothetical protein